MLWVSQDLAAGRAWEAAAVSGIPAASYAAVAVAGPLGGALADRLDRRTLMAVTELIRAGMCGALALLSLVNGLPVAVWLRSLYAVVFGLNGCGQAFTPARTAMIASIVPGDVDRTRATGLAAAATSAAGVIGPLIAVPLTLSAGIQWALAINAVSYLVSWATVRSLPLCPGHRGRRMAAELAEGLRVFANSRYLTALLSVTVICQLGTGVLTALNVLAVRADLHGNAGTYGAAEMVMGAGYIAGSIAAGRLVRALGARTVTCAGLFGAGVLTGAYALARDIPAGLTLLACYAVTIAVLNTSVAPLLMGSVPGEYLGRAMSVSGPVNQAAAAASVLTSGWLAAGPLGSFRFGSIGPVSLLLLIGAALITAAGVRALTALPAQHRNSEIRGRQISGPQAKQSALTSATTP